MRRAGPWRQAGNCKEARPGGAWVETGWESSIWFDFIRQGFNVSFMQMTIEIPERLEQRLGPERGHLAELIEMGLRLRQWTGESALAQEVIGFLARGPGPEEITGFRPSDEAVERSRELLRRNEEGSLTAAEAAELDEMALLDLLVTLIKARVWQNTHASA